MALPVTFTPYMRLLLPLLAAGALAWIVFGLARTLRIESGAARNLRAYLDDAGRPGRQEQIGARLARLSPVSLEAWELHLRWAQRGGHYAGGSIGLLVFNALALAGGGLLVFLLRPAPLFLPVPLVGFAFPFVALRAKANRVRRQVIRALPETAALAAAEVSAGSPPEQALLRAADLPGPLAGLLAEAVTFAGQSGRPLFSRKPVRGALVEVFDQTRLPALRAFALQIDEVAGKGVDAAELMNDAARALSREYRDRVLTEKEKLGGRLTTAVAFFFFFPAVLLILAAFLMPMLALF